MQAGITQDSVQNKLILLFIFDKMETAMTENTILDLCAYKNNWIDYLNCKQTLANVLEDGFVYKSTPNGRDTDVLYDLTTEGRVCLAYFYTHIPSSVRQMIADEIKKNRIEFRRKQDYVANYEKCPDGSYNVTLRIEESTKTILVVQINVMTKNVANYLERNWQKKAPLTYSKLEELLID